MIIKAIFDHENDFDYIYCPENISISKYEIKQAFYLPLLDYNTQMLKEPYNIY